MYRKVIDSLNKNRTKSSRSGRVNISIEEEQKCSDMLEKFQKILNVHERFGEADGERMTLRGSGC